MPSQAGDPGLITQRGCLGSVARFWQRSYAPDYVAFTFLAVAYLLILLLVEPFRRMFSISNINLQYPYADVERVPMPLAIGFAGGIPLAVMSVWLTASRSSSHKSHVTLLGFFIALILASFVTEVIKNAVGRPRPDLLLRCKPHAGTAADKLVEFSVCTEPDSHTLKEGWRSFPSGHASFSFAGLGYLTLFMCGQMHIFHPRADLARGLLAFSPLLGATMIAISRFQDYRHDVYDVTCGAVLGFAIAYFSYMRYFPSLGSPDCDEPFRSRNDVDEFLKLKSDEERAREDFILGDIDGADDER